ncbi:PREDICTED: uncharacterized protein LOC108660784 isoform X2 [Theobroma cacao]|nr:PREDICTED: uncharacterized protein LOC108660784 isoform X2 [Theobroma cacao]
MEHQLEARISTLERNQEEFRHDLREMKGQIAKLMEMVECLNRTNGIHPQEFQSLQTEPRLKQPLKEGQFVLDRTNISLSDPNKDQGLKKVIKGMDEFNMQMIELKSSISKMGPLSPAPPLNSGLPPSTYFQPTTFRPTFQPMNIGLRPSFHPCPSTFQSPSQQAPRAQLFTQSSITLAPSLCVIQKQSKKKQPKQLDLIPISYGELFRQLVQDHLVAAMPIEPLKPPYPKWYNPNARCDYHGGIMRHSIEDYTAFKHKVQALIDVKWFDPAKMVGQGDKVSK